MHRSKSQTEEIIRENLERIKEWRIEGKSIKDISRLLCISHTIYYVLLRTMTDLRDAHDYADTVLLEEKLVPTAIQRAIGYKEETTELLRNKDTNMPILDELGDPVYYVTKVVTKCSNTVLMQLLERLDVKKFGKNKEESGTDELALGEELKDMID
jgi:hypothetical protein